VLKNEPPGAFGGSAIFSKNNITRRRVAGDLLSLFLKSPIFVKNAIKIILRSPRDIAIHYTNFFWLGWLIQ